MAVHPMARYAESFIGVPYKWGGNNPIEGFDCSGFVQEVLVSFGYDPVGDQTAQALFDYYKSAAVYDRQPQDMLNEVMETTLLFFGKSIEEISHVALALDGSRMIEAGGGGSKTRTREDAASQGAFVRIRPITHRKDLVAIVNLHLF